MPAAWTCDYGLDSFVPIEARIAEALQACLELADDDALRGYCERGLSQLEPRRYPVDGEIVGPPAVPSLLVPPPLWVDYR